MSEQKKLPDFLRSEWGLLPTRKINRIYSENKCYVLNYSLRANREVYNQKVLICEGSINYEKIKQLFESN